MQSNGRRSGGARPRVSAVIGIALFLGVAVTGTTLGISHAWPQPGSQALVAAPIEPMPTAPRPPEAGPIPTPPGTTERVSVGADGRQGDGASGGASALVAGSNGDHAISADGRWVAFASAATNLVPGRLHPAGDLFLRDRQSGTTVAVPWVDAGPFPEGVNAAEPAISSDGGVVAFTAIVSPGSAARGLVGQSTTPYVLAWDRQTNLTQTVSVDANRRPVPGFQPSVSGDGRYVAYTAWSVATAPPELSNLVTDGFPSDGQYYIFGPSAPCTPHSATISVTATDPDDAVSEVVLSYQPNGGGVLVKAMTNSGSNVWRATIVAEDGWATGRITYWVQARDSQGNRSAVLNNAGNYLLNKGDCIL